LFRASDFVLRALGLWSRYELITITECYIFTMRLILSIVIHIFSNIVAFLTAMHFLDTFTLSRDPKDLLLLGVLFALINMFVRPILKLIFAPIIIITLGLFLIIINALTLYITDLLSAAVTIPDFTSLLLATLIISFVNYILHFFTK